MSMNGRRIVITGAFGALGRGVVSSALEQGAKVIAMDYAPADSAFDQENLVQLGGVDLTQPDAAQQAFQKAADSFGGFDGLINIVGGFVWEMFDGSNIDSWEKMFSINVRTAVISCQSALPFLSAGNQASIVNISANSIYKCETGVAAYTASKAGVAKLTESLADEYKGKVRVNAVLPSIIDTPINRKDMPDADYSTWVTPAELANVILFLSSVQASAVTGALVPVVGRV
ncbi:SDR family NAD(P)-dependent oxidoreductase [Aestuariicella hydrocarbonica]|uniref:SDR family NAD(P)-dependent oxidoreductase n=1 Tax=Pseudomaricurvus hydrocarbonicus TaxID=1470433 RepID=A0A9E5JUA1_9GAMM|nr:SDR family NAD(P)-dependent oxidoreductase [Aestuariicella hydrocarbonica]NHO66674.1 SDR family NAD(P)-dependent oxidoreductase [Aestuariicella hydrocarbonica]